MALFKIFKGTDVKKLTDPNYTINGKKAYIDPVNGYCYFDTTTGLFFVDAENNDGDLVRAPINANKAIYDAYGDEITAANYATKNEGTFFIEGSGTTDATAKTSTWIGSSDRITSYYDGLAIRYKIGVAGQTTTTLNINNLGAKVVYRFSDSKLTTHFPVGSIINLIYHEDLNNGCWLCNDYDANTNTYQRVYKSSDNVEYPITARYKTTDGASYYAEYGRYTNGVTLNPSTNTITATTFKGKATSADKINTDAGSATQPVYFANGIPVKTTYTLGKSVPSNAKFTDTTYSEATTSANGLMSAADKTKLDGIEAGVSKYNIYASSGVGKDSATLRYYTYNSGESSKYSIAAKTKNDTNAWALGGAINGTMPDLKYEWYKDEDKGTWGGEVQVITAANLANGSTVGAVKTTSTVTDASGLTACPIISGVPYYKDTNTTYSAATTSAAGLMSAADKTKLDGIATGANKTTVDASLSSTSTNPVQNKVINTALSGKLALAGGTMTGNITMDNSASAQSGEPYIQWATVGSNKPYTGFAHDQSDGTFIICSMEKDTATNGVKYYRNGLAIGGGSGNLFWKGNRVLDNSDLTTLNSAINGKLSTSGTAAKATADANGNNIANTYAIKPVTYTASITTTWSGAAAPYTQNITVSGITALDEPIVDIILSTDYDTSQSQLVEWGKIYKIVTAANQITVYATEKTTAALSIHLKIIN